MKKVFFLFLTVGLLASCKKDAKTETEIDASSKSYDQNDGLVTMRGDFIYVAKDNAAVLQTPNEIYGVVIDEKLLELDKKVQAFKKEATDMVPVTLRVKRSETNDPNTWKYRVEIKDILKIEAPSENKDDVIKLGS